MGVSVSSIPSINVPFTDKEGRINPIWHEFLRSFIAAAVEDTGGDGDAEVNVIAGAGLTGGGEISDDITLTVGTGSGVRVDADSINVDISNQTSVQVTNEDEIMISDVSDNNTIRKTRVRDINALASNPGGSNTYVQYNDNGVFGADSGFTYIGAGSATLSTKLTISDIKIEDEGAVDTIYFDGTSSVNGPHFQSDGSGGYTLFARNTGSNIASVYFNNTNGNCLTLTVGTATVTMGQANEGLLFSGQIPIRRCLETSISASTTQTQGNGSLTRDYNNVTTVTNVNDVVTLPAALASRFCIVRNAGANILQVFPASGDDLGAGVNTSITVSPGAHCTWFAIDATTWHQLEGLLRKTISAGLTASTTQTQGQRPLTQDVNEVSTVANANDVVTLPTAPAYSRTIIIINNGANTLQIFPASGDNLGAGVDTSTTLASGANVRYTNYNATNWEAI